MRQRQIVALGVFAAIVATAGIAPPAAAQDGPRTAWGAPDLQGVWDFRTITPLQRPEQYGDREFLTQEEAATLEQGAVDRDERLLLAPPRRTEAGGSVGAYNNFWMDRGTRTIGTRRTSLIIDPPNGRMPALSEAGQARADARRERRADHPADSWLDRSTFDRCILGFNTGPPMTPGGYNQNMQVFQTEDTVVILNEMVHDSRIIPIDGTPRTGIGSWTGESRGRWEGDTLVIETEQLHRQDPLARLVREHDPGRAAHPAGRRHPGLHVHGDRPRHLGAAVDGRNPDAAGRGAALRVRLPRGQLLDGGHPRRGPRRRAGGGRAAVAESSSTAAPVATHPTHRESAPRRGLPGRRSCVTARPPLLRVRALYRPREGRGAAEQPGVERELGAVVLLVGDAVVQPSQAGAALAVEAAHILQHLHLAGGAYLPGAVAEAAAEQAQPFPAPGGGASAPLA